MMHPIWPADEECEELVRHSYRNFHAKGMDYLCLKRTPNQTIKIYILDGDASKLPEVVNPHDHRYDFTTTVLHGEMEDRRFERNPNGETYDAFDYDTPLNGGDGFTHRGEETLLHTETIPIIRGQSLHTRAELLHTISMRQDQTVLMLDQGPDVIEGPTSCWVTGKHPNLDGLYERFTVGEFIDKIKWLKSIT